MSTEAAVKKPTHNEDIKAAVPTLAGNVVTTMQDPAADRFAEDDTQFLKFHGIYQQDDRDLRKTGKKYMFMIRGRIPGGVLQPEGYLTYDRLSTEYGNNTLRLTSRQSFQFHGVVMRGLGPLMKGINDALMDTLAACGDVSRNVMAPATPPTSAFAIEVNKDAVRVSEALLPKTKAYHSIWVEGVQLNLEDPANKDFVDPLYGRTYLPRKFKVAFVIAPSNDVDIFANDLGFTAIHDEAGNLQGYNVTVGGGLGRAHGNSLTYPRMADLIGFATQEQIVEVAKTVLTIHRDYGDRTDRKHARLKYIVEERGPVWFRAEVERRLGYALADAVPVKFESQRDPFGWHRQADGNLFLGLFVLSGRIKDEGAYRLKTALRKVVEKYRPEVRLTPQQNIILAHIAPAQQEEITALLAEHGVAVENQATILRRASMACPALPTCGLSLAESERYLPGLLDRIEHTLGDLDLAQEEIVIRMTGCPNGCARPYMAELGFVGKGPGRYQLWLGGNESSTRINKIYRETVKDADIINELKPLFERWKETRLGNERFGDWSARVVWPEIPAPTAPAPDRADRSGACAGLIGGTRAAQPIERDVKQGLSLAALSRTKAGLMRPYRQIALFFLASLGLLFVTFGDALWGRTLLAPIDIAPALWAKYGYIDPQSNGVPRNQHLSDQLSYDLPLQHLLHAAWRRGEVPWWDPYSMGGRPLLADAHCNGADPWRVAAYLALPDFVTAYNWTKALHALWGALGVFLVLRGLSPAWVAGGLALAFQVAGWKVQVFGHPWVEGTLCWYPWLWLAWQKSWQGDRRWTIVGGGLCVTAIFLAGNLQSHAYLPLFALAAAWAWAGTSPGGWWRAAKTLAPSLLAGGLLALPLLLAELELFHLNAREIVPGGAGFPLWNVPLAFTGLHPWLLGTARTGSLNVGQIPAFGFALWAGAIVLPLAVFGLRGTVHPVLQIHRRLALSLIVGWLIVISTPLHWALYARYVGLPVMGLLILAALGLERLRLGVAPARWAGGLLLFLLLGTALVGDVVGRWIYPRFKAIYAARLAARMSDDGYGGRSARLRAAQVEAIPGELSLANPEVALAVLALSGLVAIGLHPRWRQRQEVWCGLLLLNLISPILYARRFIPAAPRAQWALMLAGPPEQRDFFARLRAERARLEDFAEPTANAQNQTDSYAGFLPQEFSAAQRIHVLHGYAALHPANALSVNRASATPLADYRLDRNGVVTDLATPRFAWLRGQGRPPTIMEESLCALELALPEARGGLLVRRDTAYPGWTAAALKTGVIPTVPAGTVTQLSVTPETAQVAFGYRPTGLAVGLTGSAAGGLLLLAFALVGRSAASRLEKSR